MRRLIYAASFTALLTLAFFASARDEAPGTDKPIVPGVWFREGEMKNGHCNNVIIEMKDYLIVVDANFPSGARLAMADARKLSPKPVKYVFDTHHHGDHAYGNPVWTAAGATTLAYKGVVDEMNRYEPKRWQAEAKVRPDVGELNRAEPEKPQQTFDKSPYILKDETREVRFMHLGWAHTRGDAFVWLPKEKVLCTGDAVVNGPHNNTADANLANWPKVLDAAIKLKPAYVLPGHGASGGPELLTGQRQFFVDLYAAAKANRTELPAQDANWVGPSLKTQLRDATEEIRQKKPRGDLGDLPKP